MARVRACEPGAGLEVPGLGLDCRSRAGRLGWAADGVVEEVPMDTISNMPERNPLGKSRSASWQCLSH
jgi:hypothetical protein